MRRPRVTFLDTFHFISYCIFLWAEWFRCALHNIFAGQQVWVGMFNAAQLRIISMPGWQCMAGVWNLQLLSLGFSPIIFEIMGDPPINHTQFHACDLRMVCNSQLDFSLQLVIQGSQTGRSNWQRIAERRGTQLTGPWEFFSGWEIYEDRLF